MWNWRKTRVELHSHQLQESLFEWRIGKNDRFFVQKFQFRHILDVVLQLQVSRRAQESSRILQLDQWFLQPSRTVKKQNFRFDWSLWWRWQKLHFWRLDFQWKRFAFWVGRDVQLWIWKLRVDEVGCKRWNNEKVVCATHQNFGDRQSWAEAEREKSFQIENCEQKFVFYWTFLLIFRKSSKFLQLNKFPNRSFLIDELSTWLLKLS